MASLQVILVFLMASFQAIFEKIFDYTIGAVFEKIFDYTIGAVGRHIGYANLYESNVENLKRNVREFEATKDDVQRRVDKAKRNVEKIEDNVENWLTDVEKITVKVGEFFVDDGQATMKCGIGLCPNWKARYQLSKRAYKLGLHVKEISDRGKFSSIGYREPIHGIGIPTSTEGYVDFESRKSIFEGVLEALKDENIRAIGVYGMGGTGKTTLVEKVAKQASEEELFDEVRKIVVSQTPNLENIQKDIATELDLTFKDETKREKALLLHRRLNEGKKILIIIDDIWKEDDLDQLKDYGIFFKEDNKKCKRLLTSRIRYVLATDIGDNGIFHVGVLPYNEATDLFWKIVGNIVETSDFQSIAAAVIKECGGLPIAITVVGRALKSKKNLIVWRTALQKLKANLVDTTDKKLYNCIKLSYEFLTEEGRKLFLFCSIFPEDVEITIAFLWRLLVGLDFLKDVNTVEDVRNSVYTLVEELKACCLLLEGKESGRVKMHDVVRDVAIYIADKDKHMLTIRRPDDLKNSSCEDSILIAPFGLESSQLPERLECPRVKWISLSSEDFFESIQIPNLFFEGMKNLQVLVVYDACGSKLPSSLLFLDNLQALHLIRCKLEDIAMIGELKNLKVLNLTGSMIRQLPKEIEQLTDLKLLDLTDCFNLRVIPPNVLSKLKKLEELYMKGSFDKWEIEEQSMERRNARISDLDHLSHLTTLQIKIPNVKILSKFLFLEKLERYEILIGNDWDWDWDDESEYKPEIFRKLKLCLDRSFQLEVGIKKILKSCECLYLGEMEGFDCIPDEDFPKLKYLYSYGKSEIQYIISWTGVPRVAFPLLKSIYLGDLIKLEKICHGQLAEGSFGNLTKLEADGCDSLRFIISWTGVPRVAFPLLESISLNRMIKLEKICHGQLAEGSFGNLTKLKVSFCDSLRFMFSSSVVGSLSKLQEIEIRECRRMSAIVAKESEEEIEINDITTNTMEFPQLCCLRIQNVPNLMGFYSGVDSHSFFNEKVGFPKLEEIDIYKVDNLMIIWQNQLVPHSFYKLKKLNVHHCRNLKKVFPDNMLRMIQNLEELKISNCASVEEIFEINGVNVEETIDTVASMLRKDTFLLRELKLYSLEVSKCGRLKNLVPSSISFRNLHDLKVSKCHGLSYLVASSTAKSLVQLWKLVITECNRMTEIVRDEGKDEAKEEISFSQLKYLKLHCLPSLNGFNLSNHTIRFPSLTEVIVTGCPELKIFSNGVLSTPELTGVEQAEDIIKYVWGRYEPMNSKRLWEGDLNTTIKRFWEDDEFATCIQQLFIEKANESTGEDELENFVDDLENDSEQDSSEGREENATESLEDDSE